MDKSYLDIVKYENNEYKRRKNIVSRITGAFCLGLNSQLYKMVHYYRLYIYSHYNSKSFLKKLYYEKKYRKYSIRTNCEIYSKSIGKGFRVYHGGVVIGANSILKDNVKMHGHNCIGNNGKDKLEPVIGNNVNIGFGAVIIGNVEIADNIVIGANSVVTKSFLEPGITIAGNPARKIK